MPEIDENNERRKIDMEKKRGKYMEEKRKGIWREKYSKRKTRLNKKIKNGRKLEDVYFMDEGVEKTRLFAK